MVILSMVINTNIVQKLRDTCQFYISRLWLSVFWFNFFRLQKYGTLFECYV